jgi:hypothetical protein
MTYFSGTTICRKPQFISGTWFISLNLEVSEPDKERIDIYGMGRNTCDRTSQWCGPRSREWIQDKLIV